MEINNDAVEQEVKKLNEQELGELRALKQSEYNITLELGRLEIQKMLLFKELDRLLSQTLEFRNALKQEYGEVENVDLETGELS